MIMLVQVLKKVMLSILLLAIQIFLLNRISVLWCAIPYVYIIMIMICDPNGSVSGRLVSAFCMGLVVDIFSDTPGVQAAALTLLAFLQPSLIRLFMTLDKRDHIVPGAGSMGWVSYPVYILICTLIFVLTVALLSSVSSPDWITLTVGVVLSTLMSVALILCIELVFRRNIRGNKRRRFL